LYNKYIRLREEPYDKKTNRKEEYAKEKEKTTQD
jgi:hypothetical protein